MPTNEYLVRHALESFLDRLSRTAHANDFVLKGGILLAAYGARRPTKDVDAEAVQASVTPAHIAQVVRDIADVDVDDGLVIDLDTISFEDIREEAEYAGMRMRVAGTIGHHPVKLAWDISTGDPDAPMLRQAVIGASRSR